MKKTTFILSLILSISMIKCSQQETSQGWKYLDQTPPGDTPVVFAPGIVSTDSTVEHGAPTFSPDGNEVFWQSNLRHSGKETQIFGMTMKRVGDTWTAPDISPYTGGPVFSPDGKRLYFLPIGKENGEENGPYFVEKQGNSWSEPKCLGLITRFPELRFVYNHSITRNGTLYFLGYAEGLELYNNFGIYRTELINGEYAKPELLPPSINTPGGFINWTPYIAPDESYLIFSSRRIPTVDDNGGLHICFRQSDGSWTDRISLGKPINSKGSERFPTVSPDGKYLFFTRFVSNNNEDVFWVSAGIIEKLRKEALK